MKSRPSFVRLDVLEFFRWVDDHKEDLSSAVSNLAKCLMLGKAEEGSYARKLLDEANEFRSKKSEAGRKGMESRWGNSQEAANGNGEDDCKVPPSCTNFADGDTREGSLNTAHTGNRAHLESRTSAKTSGSKVDAPVGNAGDELAMPARVVLESATSTVQQDSVRGSAKPACGQVATGRKQLPPPTKEAVYDFARTAKLDTDDAREWFEINFVDRPGCDKDGIVIENWKGAMINYCMAKAKRRKL